LSLVNASLELSTLTSARTVAGASWVGTVPVTVPGGREDPAARPPGWVQVGSAAVEAVQVQSAPVAAIPLNGVG
jgi:hypothetical protein